MTDPTFLLQQLRQHNFSNYKFRLESFKQYKQLEFQIPIQLWISSIVKIQSNQIYIYICNLLYNLAQ